MRCNEPRVLGCSFRGGTLAALLGSMALATSGCSSQEGTREARAVAELTPELAPVVSGNNRFAWNLYREAAGQQGNLFFSPFSISAALGMTYAGAAGETAEEMRGVLAIVAEDRAFHTQFGALIRDLNGPGRGRGYELLVANRLFGAEGLGFQPEFRVITANDYAAPIETLNFAEDAARRHINGWVRDQTREKIRDLLEPGQLAESTTLVLVNAIYFNAQWAHRFDPDATAPMPFHLADGTTVPVPTMSNMAHYRCASSAAEHVIEVPYQDDELAMMVVIPAATQGLAALESTLSAERVDAWAAALEDCEVRLQLPRFEVEATLPATELLQRLGMQRAFFPGADFSKLLDPVANVLIDDVVHRAYVKVDERGTEAAAATAVVTRTVSAAPEFVADAPFLYFVRDRLTGSVLFIGRMADPRAPKGG